MTHPQLIQKHDHPMFVVFDERVHTLHVGFLLMRRDNCQIPATLSVFFAMQTILHLNITAHTLAPNSTRLARFWTDLATSVRVLPAVDDGGSAKGNEERVNHTYCDVSQSKERRYAVVLFNTCSPEMMLNIRGLRMAGQISLRKTKPLEKES